MIFEYVKWKNFHSYGDYETRIELSRKNICLIVGLNGSGKTTMVDAIVWVLYGRSLASMNEVVNRHTKKDCKAEVGFSVGNDKYAVVRYRNHNEFGNKLLLYKNQKDITLRNANDTQNEILNIIQIPYHAMVSSIIFSSEIYTSFLRSKGAERLRVFDEVLNLKLVSSYYEMIKKFRKPIQDELNEQNNKKGKVDSVIKTLEQSIVDYKSKIRGTLLELKQRKEKISEEVKSAEIHFHSLKEINYENELKQNEEYDKIIEHNKEVEELIEKEKLLIKKLDEVVDKYNEIKDEIGEIDEIDVVCEFDKIDAYNEIKTKNMNIDNYVLSVQQKIINIQADLDKIKEFETKYNELVKEIEDIKCNITICPTCKQEVDISINKEIIQKKEEEGKNIKEEKSNLEKGMDKSQKDNAEINKRIENSIKQKEEIPDSSKYEESYLKSLESKVVALDRKKIIAEQEIKSKQDFNMVIENKVFELKEKVINEIPEHSKYDTEFLLNLKKEIENYENKIRELVQESKLVNEKAKSAYDKNYVEDAENKKEKLLASFESINEKLEEIKNNDFHHEVLQDLFSNKEGGIKRLVIDKMIDLFNKKINFYLPLFFDEIVRITFNKELVETITIDNETVGFNTFSSGEKARLELAIAFSLFMLVKAFFSTSINLLVFDEILDMNLDDLGIQSVLEIIRNLSKDNTIIVISHKDNLKETFSNDRMIAVKTNGFSKMTQEA